MTIMSISLIITTFFLFLESSAQPMKPFAIIGYPFSSAYLMAIGSHKRIMPTPTKWSPSQRKVLEVVLSSPNHEYTIDFDGETSGYSAVHRGLMYRSRDKLCFPSPLHRLILSRKLYRTHWTFTEDQLEVFLETIISHTDWNSQINHTLSKGAGPDAPPYERQFQMECNRTATTTLGGWHHCYPDVG